MTRDCHFSLASLSFMTSQKDGEIMGHLRKISSDHRNILHWEGTHRGCQVQLLAPYSTTQKSDCLSESTVQTPLGLWHAQCHNHHPLKPQSSLVWIFPIAFPGLFFHVLLPITFQQNLCYYCMSAFCPKPHSHFP